MMRAVKDASAGGEWVSVAFDGEGMCFAWLCGRALSQMIASGKTGGQEAAGVPERFSAFVLGNWAAWIVGM